MTDKLSSALSFHQTALNLRAYRQELIASNIANADTPHYKARDVDFKTALQNALGGARAAALPLARTSAGHLPVAGSRGFAAATAYRGETQASVDGNTVNVDTERAAFAENSVQYEASVTFINGVLRSMQTAITGQ